MMSSIIDNHEIIDTLQKKGWTFEEVVKSVYYFWEYVHMHEHKWFVNPSDLIDHLRNTAIDYDSSYVSICQNDEEKVEINMVSMVGKNDTKMMYSPAIWKIRKNIKEYYQLVSKLSNENFIDLHKLLQDYIREINASNNLNSTNEDDDEVRYACISPDEKYDIFLLDKEMKSYIDVLTMFKLYDYSNIKSIYNLGNNSFIVEINNDTNDQVMHLQLKDRTIDEWVTNGKPNGKPNGGNKDKIITSASKLRQIHDLFHDIAKVLVKIGVKSLTELKKITIKSISNNHDIITLVLENGSMYDIIREATIVVDILELEENICEHIDNESDDESDDDSDSDNGDHSSDSDYVDESDSDSGDNDEDDDSSSDDLEVILDDDDDDSGDDGDHSSDSDYVDNDDESDHDSDSGDDSDSDYVEDESNDDDGKYVDKVDFTTNITFVDNVLEDYPDEPINTTFERQNMVYGEGPHLLSRFNERMSDDRITTILGYIQDNLIHWKCNDILEIKYIRFYPKSRNYRIVFNNGSEIEAGKIVGRYYASIVNRSPFNNEPNIPYHRRPVNALKTIADLFERCNITNISSVYQIDINNCEYIIHLVNDTRIVTYKTYYYDGSIIDPNIIKVVKNINKYAILSKDDVDLYVDKNTTDPNKLNIDNLLTIIYCKLSSWCIDDIDEVKCIKYYANETKKFHAGSFVVYLSNGNVLRSIIYNHNGCNYRKTHMVGDHPREHRFVNNKKYTVSKIILYIIKLLTKKFGIYYPDTINTILFKDENFIINTTDGLKIVSNKVYGLDIKLEDEKGEYIQYREKEDIKELHRFYKEYMQNY